MSRLVIAALWLICTYCSGTVSTTSCRASYSGDGSDVTFTFSFPVTDDGDLIVILRDNDTGAETVQSEPTQYALSAVNNDFSNGGTVTFISAPSTSQTILLLRATPATQETDLDDSGVLRLESLEAALDRLTFLVQQNQEELNRCLKYPRTDAASISSSVDDSVSRASRYLYFGDNGAPAPSSSVVNSTATVSAFMETVLDDVNASAVATTSGLIYVNNVRTFGAVGDGITDDANAIQQAIDASASDGYAVYFPPGVYKITSGLTSNSRLEWFGVAGRSEILVAIGATTAAITITSTSSSADHTVMRGLSFIGSNNSNLTTLKFVNCHYVLLEDIWVRTEAESYGFHFDSCLGCTLIHCGTLPNVSANSASYNAPDTCFYFDEGTGNIAPNVNMLVNCYVQGCQDASSYAVIIDTDDTAEGDMTITGGTIENCAGSGLYVEMSRHLTIDNLHIENISGTYGAYFKNCYEGRYNLNTGGDSVYFESCTLNLISGYYSNLTMDSGCRDNSFGPLYIGNSFTDNGTNNCQTAPVQEVSTQAGRNVCGDVSPPVCESTNIFRNSDISYWPNGTNIAPQGFSNAAIPTLSRESTIVLAGDYSLKVVCDNATEGIRTEYVHNMLSTKDGLYTTLLDNEQITITVWVYNTTAGTLTLYGEWYTGAEEGAPSAQSTLDSTATTNTWVKLKGSVRMTSTYDVLRFKILHGASTSTWYVDCVTVYLGTGSSRGYTPSNQNLTHAYIERAVSTTQQTISADDTSPNVSDGWIFITSTNTIATAITDLDNPAIGSVYILIGGSNTNSSTVADSGNFALSGNWTASLDDVLILYVQADNDYIEIGRVNN